MIRILSFLYRPSVKNNLPFSIDPDEIIYHISEIGRSFTKCRDIACHFRTITVKKLERFEHKIVWTWNMKYLLPNSFSGPKFFIRQLSESLKMRKVLSGWNRIHKLKAQIFWIFTDFHEVIRVQSPTCTQRIEISAMATPTSKLPILCRFIFR